MVRTAVGSDDEGPFDPRFLAQLQSALDAARPNLDAIVGVQRTGAKCLVEPDRERAIELALDQARPGDIVLLAGKGHETTQGLRERTIEFDDREIARRILRQRGFGD